MTQYFTCQGCGNPITATTLNCKRCGHLALDVKHPTKPGGTDALKVGCVGVSAVLGLIVALGVVGTVVNPVRQPPSASPSSTPTSASSAVPTDRAGLMTYINGLIAKGDEDSTTNAMVLVHERFTPDEIRDDAEVHSLLDRAMAAAKIAGAGTREQDYAERVNTYWLPQITKISTTAPTAPEDLWAEQSSFEDLARSVAEGAEFKTGIGAAARRRFYRALSAKQQQVFPVLRSAYGKILRSQMWKLDVEIATTGAANRTLNFVGGRFALNQNIDDAQQAVQDYVMKLRFKTTHYEWFKGAGGYSYPISSPNDVAVGVWNNGTFEVTPD